MYCKYCGKELSNEAIMCPNCGTPTDLRTNPSKPQGTDGTPRAPFGLIALIFAAVAFLTGIIFGAFFLVPYFNTNFLLYFICGTAILPGIASIGLASAALYHRGSRTADRVMAIIAIVLAVIVLLFLFLSACVIASKIYY